tara:strand:- start:216 stop:1997 length:1782 start_codon:yes stop_codon:yes gene_type:complete
MTQEIMDSFLSTIDTTGRYICPICSETRKKKSERTLSVTVESDSTVYMCHHCEISGSQKQKETFRPTVTAISVPKTADGEGLHLLSNFLGERGINYENIKDRFQIVTAKRFFKSKGDIPGGEVDAIGFVYGNKEAIKWRPLGDKRFTQDGAARIFWGVDQARAAPDANTIVITEGEIDALSVGTSIIDEQIVVVSVPNGAPQRVSNRRVDPSEDNKFNYVWEAKDLIEDCEKIILAVDLDEAGEALREELARRIGRGKCYQVNYPAECKDMNDVLVRYGEGAVRKLVEEAEPMPLEGVYMVDDYRAEVNHLYHNGVIGGLSTGMAPVDDLFTIVQGQLSVVTGVPGSGKSEFIDQLMVNLAKTYDWKFAVASFENPPPLHIAKLAEKIVGKPFFNGPNQRMDKEESEQVLEYINDHWMFLEQRSGEAATIDSILDRARSAILRKGIRGLVIDPYNYIANTTAADNEHQSINDMLTRLVSFARSHEVHIWFIAHPSKMPTDQSGTTAVPKGMNISGSASFFAKADLGITVHQNQNKEVEVHCWKVRFKWIGSTGKCTLDYDIPSGRYSEQTIEEIKIPSSLSAKSFQETNDDWD